MATIKEHIAQHTRSEAAAQQQPVADDPLAPKPIRFTHQRGVDGVIHQRSVNEPTTGWHLEDDSTGEDADEQYTAQARPPRSAMRYQDTLSHQYRGQTVLPTPPQRLRRQRLTGNAPGQQQRPSTRRRKPWSVYLVTGMATMTALVVGLYSLGSWWQHVQDDWTYGMPRTYQTDAVVGHNHDSSSHPSHFLAVNLKGRIEVFELPAGDPTKVRVFFGPTIAGNGADQVVVTISFTDSDHDGTPDLILHYGDSAEVLYNKGGTFLLPGGKSSAQGRSTLA